MCHHDIKFFSCRFICIFSLDPSPTHESSSNLAGHVQLLFASLFFPCHPRHQEYKTTHPSRFLSSSPFIQKRALLLLQSSGVSGVDLFIGSSAQPFAHAHVDCWLFACLAVHIPVQLLLSFFSPLYAVFFFTALVDNPPGLLHQQSEG